MLALDAFDAPAGAGIIRCVLRAERRVRIEVNERGFCSGGIEGYARDWREICFYSSSMIGEILEGAVEG